MKAWPMIALVLLAAVARAQDPPAESEYAPEINEIREFTGFNIELVESDNFIFAFTMNKAQGQPIVQASEDAFKAFKELVGLSGWEELWGPAAGGTKKALIAVLKDKPQYVKFLEWYQKRYNPWAGFKDEAAKVTYIPNPAPRPVIPMHLKPLDIKGLRNVAAHTVGHLCVLRYKFNNNFMPAWVEEGFACWVEAKTLGRNNCYCFSGGYGDRSARLEKVNDLEAAKWKSIVAEMVKGHQDKALRQIIPMTMGQLTATEMGKSWSVLDWMIAQDPKKFAEFLSLMKRYWPPGIVYEYNAAKGEAEEKALKEVFKLDFDGLDKAWREWVPGVYKVEKK